MKLPEKQFQAARALLYDGTSYETVARRMGLSINTVAEHMKQVFRKTQVSSSLELAVAVWSGRMRIVDPLGRDLMYYLRQ